MRIPRRTAGAVAAFAGITALTLGTAAPSIAQAGTPHTTHTVSAAPHGYGCGYWDDDCGWWGGDYYWHSDWGYWGW